MVLFVTYCSRDKDPAPGMLPAIDRYLSERIRMVQRLAGNAGAGFRILSGRYGLVSPEQEIPDYDHLLTADMVASHSRFVTAQMQGLAVEKVVFHTRPLDEDPGAEPYRDVVAMACKSIGAAFEIQEIRTGR